MRVCSKPVADHARPNHELISLDAESFDRLVWQHLNQLELGLGYEPAPPDVVH